MSVGGGHLLRKYCFVSLWSSGADVVVAAVGRGSHFLFLGRVRKKPGEKRGGNKEKIEGLSPFPLN